MKKYKTGRLGYNDANKRYGLTSQTFGSMTDSIVGSVWKSR